MIKLRFCVIMLLFSVKGLKVCGQILGNMLHPSKGSKVFVASHRGDWRNAPENSIAAFKSAIQKGVDIIEVDLKMTKDSVLVIMHDQTLNRSTTAKGKPSEYTIKELMEFKLRDGLGVPTTQTIPTLKEVMLLAKGKVLVNLDHSTPFYREAVKVLEETGTLQQAIFKSDEPYQKLFNRYGKLLDLISFMPVIETDYGGNMKMVEEYQSKLKPVAVELVFSKDSASVFRNNAKIKSSGSLIWVNSLWPNLCGGHDDDRAVIAGEPELAWGWLISHGVNIIQTDRPKELIDYLRKRKLHD